MNDAVEGLPGVKVYVDDILVYGKGETDQKALEDHDRNVILLMKRLKEQGIKLNQNKINFQKKEVKYLGHILTTQGIKTDHDKIKAIIDLE